MITAIVTEGYDRCPKCGAEPPPGTTAESHRRHVEICGTAEQRARIAGLLDAQ